MYVSIEDQIKMAVTLCEDENATVAVMCNQAQTRYAIKFFPNSGKLNLTNCNWVAPNGSRVSLYSTESGRLAYYLGGCVFTHVIVNESVKYTHHDISYLRSRLRSTKYKGDMMMFLPKDALPAAQPRGGV